MNRSQISFLSTLSVIVALAASSALAGQKGNFNLQRSSSNKTMSLKPSVSQMVVKSQPRTVTKQFSQSGNLQNSLNLNTTGKQLKYKTLNGNLSGQFVPGTSTLLKPTIKTFDKNKLGVSPVLGSGAAPIFDPGKVTGTGPIFNPDLGPVFEPRTPGNGPIFNPDLGPIVNPGNGPIFDPDLGPIFDPQNPPVADPGQPDPNPGDPPVADPGDGGGNPPADPPVDPGNPPAEPGNPPAEPCPPPHCPPVNPGVWCFPIPFPVWGGGYGGGYCGSTVVQPVYAPVTQAVAVEPLADPVQAIDLELLEVRQLDRGDAAKNLGPAYRVTFRNKTGEAVAKEFNVGLAASIGRQATADAAFAMVRVDGLEAGQSLAVDLRLPAKAFNMGLNADGQPVPFTWLTAVADSHQEIEQQDRQNDFVVLNRSEIVMVAAK